LKVALVSQRVEIHRDRDERRDAIDQRLLDWLSSCDFLPVPVPHRPERVATLWARVRPAVVVLSGGNDLAAYGGDAVERDDTERALVTQAMNERVPVLGVCRGAQLLLHMLDHRLELAPGHVGVRHALRFDNCERTVNSYHSWGCRTRSTPLRVLARSDDDVIEAFCHPEIKLLGIMWHPERERVFHEHDRALVERHLLRSES
jgi:gamma-glutamyl-gamma-aminobutyrate hydrolase PuuD